MPITQVDAAGSILRGMEGRNYLAQMRDAQQQRTKRNQLGGLMAQYYGGHDPSTGITWNSGRQGPGALSQEEVTGRATALDPEFGLRLSKHFEGMSAAQVEENKREAPIVLSVLGNVQDQRGWDQARMVLHQQGVDISDMPSAFDPGMRDGYIAAARGLIDWKPTNVAPGTALVDPYTLEEIYKGQAAPPAGFHWTEAGGLTPIPGYVEGQQQLYNARRGPETFGQPVEALGPDGQPTFARFGNRGGVQAVQGYQPTPDSAGRDTFRNVRMPDGSVRTFRAGSDEFNAAIAQGGTLAGVTRPGAGGGLTITQQRWNASIDQARATLRQMNITPEDARRMSQKATDTGRENPEFNQYISQLVRQATKRKNGPDPQHGAFYNRFIGGQNVPLPGAAPVPQAGSGEGGAVDPMLGEIGSMDIDDLDELLNSGALTVDQVEAVDDRLNQILGGNGGQGDLGLGGGTRGDRLGTGRPQRPGAPGPEMRYQESVRETLQGNAILDHYAARGDVAIEVPVAQRTAQHWQDIEAFLARFGTPSPRWEQAERALQRHQSGGR